MAQRILGVGEAMVEFAPVDGGLFKQGFAGDTLNTCWYLRLLLPERFGVSYATGVGTDVLSNEFVSFVESSGLGTDAFLRDPVRTLGLYAITLEGAERRFSYWRDNSAARKLADNPNFLAGIFADAAVIYLSGITLAVIGERGRSNLKEAILQAKSHGTRVAFDSNLRLRLWTSEAAAKLEIESFLPLVDVALPGFDDEAALWRDSSPEETLQRLSDSGVNEVVVKNGSGAAAVYAGGVVTAVNAKVVGDAVDTTAAGDSFNAGYLAARCMGHSAVSACTFAHELAGEVVRHRGALAPRDAIIPLREKIASGKAD